MKFGHQFTWFAGFYYAKTWFKAKIMSSSKVKLIPNWGWNSFEDKFRWENQLGLTSFLMSCFHTDFLILPTVMTKLGGWGGVGWGRVGTQHPQFGLLNVFLYWLQCKEENQMYVVLIWSHTWKVVHQVFAMNFWVPFSDPHILRKLHQVFL